MELQEGEDKLRSSIVRFVLLLHSCHFHE